MTLKISKAGIELIKKFEGCILEAYKDVVGVPTIGIGHTGGVTLGQKITQAEADALLDKDLDRFEAAVNKLGLNLNQNQFDALVSFSFNLGEGNLRGLVKNRTMAQIADAILQYNHAGGEVWDGLTKRRQAERSLFLKPVPVKKRPATPVYPGIIKKGSKDAGHVKMVQTRLHIISDGIFGNGTYMAVRNFQAHNHLTVDGVIGPKTWDKLFK